MAGFVHDPITLAHKSPDYALDVYVRSNPRASEGVPPVKQTLPTVPAGTQPMSSKAFPKWPLPGETTDEGSSTPSAA